MAEKSGECIEEKAISGDRFGLIKDFLRYVKKGERRIQDVAKVGPANVEKCTMLVAEWDKTVKARKSTGQCKRIFFSTFGQRHMFRRCEEAAEELCHLCRGMREKARKDGVESVSIAEQEEYAVVHKALFTRPGVVAGMTYWETETENIKSKGGVHKLFPFFTAQQMVQMLMLDTGVIFENGGKSGRVYKRSQMIVQAQDMYLRECMENVMLILRKEKKKQFEQRLARLVKIGMLIHEQMLQASADSEMSEVGALQTSDVVRDELCRAARWTEQGTRAPKYLSVQVKQLVDWATARKRSEKGAKSEGELSMHSPSTSPPSSVSSSPSSPQREPIPTRKTGAKKPLVFRRVGTKTDGQKTSERVGQEEKLEETEVPVFKRFVIRESTIPAAGQGLFLIESAANDEAIARYSGTLMSKEAAKASGSKYTVKISADQYLVADPSKDWEGCKANCARKAQRPCNARFAANGRCNVCAKTGKHWIKIFAVGDISPEDEVLPDYGDEYWPAEEGDEVKCLPTPQSNRRSTSSSEKDDSDSSWLPSPRGKEIRGNASRTPRPTLRSSVASVNEADETEASKTPSVIRKTYAVTVGRCVGLFRSAIRMRSSVFKYSGGEHTRFTSEEDARAFMIEKGVEHPTCFWKTSYASGTLVQDPQSVVGQDIYFPVGLGVHHDNVQHGIVVESLMKDDSRVWKVQMDDGDEDYMSEWPVLCGLSLSDRLMLDTPPNRSRAGPTSSEPSKDASTTMFAIRGTSNDGIVKYMSEVFPRLQGEHAQYESFKSRIKAQRWIDEFQFFAVRFGNGDSTVVTKGEIMMITRGKKGVQVKGPSTKSKAEEEVEAWEAQRRDGKNSVYVRRASNMLRSGCIARLADGSTCGKTNDLHETLLGPLCEEHAPLYNDESAGVGETSKEKCATGKEVQYKKRRRVRAPVVEVSDEAGQDDMISPDEGIRLPTKTDSLKKDRKGRYAVVAVRTFPEDETPDEPAGSVWLSSDVAAAANVRQGEMRIFNVTNDIFENIEHAHEWIRGQVASQSEDSLEGEADKRWREAQEKVKKKKASKKGAHASVEGGRRKGSVKKKGKGRGAGRTSSMGGRGAGRGGRGAGRSQKKKEKKGRKVDSRRTETRKGTDADESDDDCSEEEDDGSDDDKDVAGASRGDRRFRKSRRRGSNRGGLRSGAVKMLDKQQKRIENQLFPANADEVTIYDFDVPDVKRCQKIPLPGKAQALTTSSDAGHVLSFSNDMKAVLSERTFKSFDAFSLADLMEFQQTVEYVASYQPEDNKRVTESVVQAVRVIANNAIHLYATMRDSDSMGNHGENFKAYTYLQVMYLVMFREAFEGALAEMFFVTYAPKFAKKARGCAGMAPFKDVKEVAGATAATSNDRCLVCGKPGHRASSDVHKAELAEGSLSTSPEQLKSALEYIAHDATLNAEQKRSWSARTKAFWGKMRKDSHNEDSL